MEPGSFMDEWIGGTVKRYEVVGNTLIGWSMTVSAEDVEDARAQAEEYWSWNQTYEDVQMDVLDVETGEVAQ